MFHSLLIVFQTYSWMLRFQCSPSPGNRICLGKCPFFPSNYLLLFQGLLHVFDRLWYLRVCILPSVRLLAHLPLSLLFMIKSWNFFISFKEWYWHFQWRDRIPIYCFRFGMYGSSWLHPSPWLSLKTFSSAHRYLQFLQHLIATLIETKP